MSTKIILDYPFCQDYKSGYLNINKEPRRIISLVNKNGTRTSISYARYLMSCFLKKYLNKDEHVDHKDDEKMNDVISNLQILSPKQNNIKKNIRNDIKLAEDVLLVCPICSIKFSRPSRNIKHKLINGKNPCCSRKCGGIYSHKKG